MRGRNCFFSIFFLFLIIISILSIDASAKQIFRSGVFPGEIIEADGYQFVLKEVDKDDVMIIEYIAGDKNESYVLHINETTITDEFTFIYTVCRFDIDEGWGKLDPINFREIPLCALEINSLLPDIEIKSSTSQKNSNLYDVTNVTLIITNSGDNSANDFVFEQHFPDEIEFIPLMNLTKKDDMLYWSGDLSSQIKLQYSIRSKSAGLKELHPNITYSHAKWVYRLAPEPIQINYEHGLKSISGLNISKLSIGESARYFVKLNNTQKNLQVSSLDIIFPENMAVTYLGYNSSDFGEKEIGDLNQNDDGKFQFSWFGNIYGNEELNFQFEILPKKITSGNIRAIASIIVDDFYSSFEMNNSLSVVYEKPSIDIEFNTSRIEYKEPINIVVVLKNKGSIKDMRNLMVYLDGNFIESMELGKDNFELDGNFPILNIIYEPQVPMVEGVPFLFAQAIYETPFGEQIDFSVNKTIISTAVTDTLKYVQDTSYEDTIEPYIPPKKTFIQKIREKLTTKIVGIIEMYTNKKTRTIDDYFILPIVILVLILGISMMKSWGVDFSKEGLIKYYKATKSFFKDILDKKFKIKK
jgi:hypothetical protein